MPPQATQSVTSLTEVNSPACAPRRCDDPKSLADLSPITVADKHARHRHTGIVCTIGPASRDVETLTHLIMSGMTIARLNCSHGDHAYHLGSIVNIRAAVEQLRAKGNEAVNVAIALDTRGPEIRTGVLAAGDFAEVELVTGSTVTIVTDPQMSRKCTAQVIYVDYKNIESVLRAGSNMYVDDGLMHLIVQQTAPGRIQCKVAKGGKLGSRKGVNLPGTTINLPAVSEKDHADLRFAVQQNLDMIFASFVRSADGVADIRRVLGEAGKDMMVIAKIENEQGLLNVDGILAAADGLMVARGDMGVEVPVHKVFLAQKVLTAKCAYVGKPSIVATHMLESMIEKPGPTRAEAGDVANAVLDGATCVMLSGETAKGKYPREAVQMMASVCIEAECLVRVMHPSNPLPTCYDPMASAAVTAAKQAALLVIVTSDGMVARSVAANRPACAVLVLCADARASRQLQLYAGLLPVHYTLPLDNVEAVIEYALDIATRRGIVQPNEQIVILNDAENTTINIITMQ